jgi:serine/threonine-protein kinase
MCEEGGRIVLMDFGLGAVAGGQSARLTRGTPHYMAPELLNGGASTILSDIYALGVLLYHLVTGEYPVQGSSLRELRENHRSGRRRPLVEARSDLPAAYVRVVDRATAPDPLLRYQSASELLQDLAPPETVGSDVATTVRQTRRTLIAATAIILV